MPNSYDYDAIVIGSGPGGEGAAMGLVKQGARVAVIERYHNVGGGCTHWGTIPSKALRHAVSRIIEFNQNPLYSDHTRLLRSSFADILNHADSVINQQTRMRQGFYERNHCEILQGNAHFVDEHTLALENIGLQCDSRGQLKVNSMYQTALPHIYAVGDVIGYPSLASAAYDQGRIAAHAMVKGEATAHLVEDIPTGIYTIPEISSVGKTEQQLTAMKVPYEVGRAQFKHLARAQIVGMNVGTLKILFHRETKEILGIHCFGERAAEIIHIGQAIMEQKGGGNTIEYFVNTTFNYPTMAEAYRVAALNGLNRLW